jgi:hypothetical protein
MLRILLRFPATLALAGLATVLIAAGCQVYDFEPVVPQALGQDARSVPLAFNRPKPNMMLLVDKSGSMGSNVTPPNPPSKITVLKQVMGDFLTNSPTVARVGLSQFPNGNSCNATTASDVLATIPPDSAGDDDAVLQAASQAADTALQGLSVNGGTPTGASLKFVYDNAGELTDVKRENFVLLLTDGLPNCNNNLDRNTCTCTSSASPPCSANTDCLDKAATVGQVQALKTDKDIGTIVIGFGGDVTGGIAQDTLEAMAEAGGFVRKCPNTNESCGTGNDCVLATGLCSKQYFQATDGPALAAALAEIGSTLTQTACVYNLVDVPSNPLLISVVVNGTPYLRGDDTWMYDEAKNQIVFQGALCAQIRNNTPDNPVRLDIRLLQVLH